MISFFVLLSLFVVFSFSEEIDDPDVVVLTKDNFDEIVNNEDLVVVEFYAPWCGHCKRLQPEYARAATVLKNDDPPVKLAKVDATIETELASRFEVGGYPTLKLFRRGVASAYEGPRQEAGIIKYVRGQAGPSAKPLKDQEAFDKFSSNEDEVGVVAFVEKDSAEEKQFIDVATKHREDVRFAIVNDAAIAKKVAAKIPSIKVFRPKTYETQVEDLKFTDALDNDVVHAALPLAGIINDINSKLYSLTQLPRITIFSKVDLKNAPKQAKYYINRLRKVAKDYVGKAKFVLEDKSSQAFNELGFDSAAEYGIAAFDAAGNKFKGVFDGKFSVANLQKFAEEFVGGKIEKYIKSEPIPEDNEGPVKVVVGKTFDDIVLNKEKDVFVEFYAPWCGHCKSLAPKWEKLGEKFADSDSLVIAKMDATANDVSPSLGVRGFPTLILFKNDGSEPVKYEGGREVKDMSKWLKENVSRKLSGKKAGKDEL